MVMFGLVAPRSTNVTRPCLGRLVAPRREYDFKPSDQATSRGGTKACQYGHFSHFGELFAGEGGRTILRGGGTTILELRDGAAAGMGV